VPPGIVGNQLGPEWKQMKYRFPQVENPENDIQWFESLFSPNAELAGSRWEYRWIYCCVIWNS